MIMWETLTLYFGIFDGSKDEMLSFIKLLWHVLLPLLRSDAGLAFCANKVNLRNPLLKP